ncbi:MAG: hypothetical protein PVJ55_09400, partial [Anaerolineae bacterium]
RAAAKNYLRVAAVVDPSDYPALVASLVAQDGGVTLTRRFELARKALAHTAAYDLAISEFLTDQEPLAVAATYRIE